MNLINPYNYVKTPFPRFDSSCLFDKSATDFYLELSLSVRACVCVRVLVHVSAYLTRLREWVRACMRVD